jgi:hypothetical protein
VGSGVVDVFDLNGNFVARAVTGGNLNAPYGVAFAPQSGFGIYSGDLLIGNFGDGIINVYDPKTYAYLGQLMDSTGKALAYAALWDVLTGGTPILNSTTVSGGSKTDVYFVAGLANEAHGLLGSIANATVSGATPTFGFSASTSAATVTGGGAATATLSAASVNGFTGTVTFACSGLPAGSSCIFSPSSLNVITSAPAISQLSISTTPNLTNMGFASPHLRGRTHEILGLASLLPFSLFLFIRRRSSGRALRIFGPLAALILCFGAASVIIGCSDHGPPPGTPTGTSNVTVTATSGSTSQKATIALTVQ